MENHRFQTQNPSPFTVWRTFGLKRLRGTVYIGTRSRPQLNKDLRRSPRSNPCVGDRILGTYQVVLVTDHRAIAAASLCQPRIVEQRTI